MSLCPNSPVQCSLHMIKEPRVATLLTFLVVLPAGICLAETEPPDAMTLAKPFFAETAWGQDYENLFAIDIDSDGDADLVCNWGKDKIAWFENVVNESLGPGENPFEKPSILYRGREIGPIQAVCDIERDGDPDLITTGGIVENRMMELEGDLQYINLDSNLNYVRLIDYDADGRRDIVYADSFLKQTGTVNSEYQFFMKYVRNRSNVDSFFFEESENLMYARKNWGGSMNSHIVYLDIPPIGDFTSTPQPIFGDSLYFKPVLNSIHPFVDIDRNGILDRIDINPTSIEIFSTSSSLESVYTSTYDIEGSYQESYMGDIDLDSYNDIFLIYETNESEYSIYFLENLTLESDNLFAAPRLFCNVNTFPSIGFENIDSDSEPEVVLYMEKELAYVDVNTENEPTQFTDPRYFNYNETYSNAVIHDFNRNGIPDVVINDLHTNRLQYFPDSIGSVDVKLPPLQIAHGVLDRWLPIPVDLDKDKKTDLLLHSKVSGEMGILDDAFNEKTRFYQDIEGLGEGLLEVTRFILSDLDLDGDTDIVTSSVSKRQLGWIENKSTVGSFDFDTSNLGSIYTPSETEYDPETTNYLLEYDLDQDGDDDIVGRQFGTNNLAWWENQQEQGGIQFSKPYLINEIMKGGEPNRIIPNDIDGDGEIDLIWKRDNFYPSHYVYMGHSNIDQRFLNRREIPKQWTSSSWFGDLTGDDKADIVSLQKPDIHEPISHMLLMENTSEPGSISFSDPITIRNDLDGTGYIFFEDFDGDGNVDIVFDNITRHRMEVYINTEGAEGRDFTKLDEYISRPRVNKALYYLTDLQEDNDLDYITGLDDSYYGENPYWYENTRSAFHFRQSEQGWTSYTGFDPLEPIEIQRSWKGLEMNSDNEVSGFGFWSSPKVLPERGKNTTEIVRNRWKVINSTETPRDTPTIRFRSSSVDFARSESTIITPVHNARTSPKAGGTVYTDFIGDNTAGTEYIFSFEALTGYVSDGSHSIALRDMETEYFDVGRLISNGNVYESHFANAGSERKNWYINTIPHDFMWEPESIYADDGLIIRGVEPDTPVKDAIIPSRFGTWTCDTGLPLKGGSTYRIQWTLASDATAENKIRVPTFRMRANESTFRFARELRIDSTTPDADIPFSEQDVTYDLWILVPEEIDDSELILSFDYLYINNLRVPDDDPMIALKLKSVEVEEFQ